VLGVKAMAELSAQADTAVANIFASIDEGKTLSEVYGGEDGKALRAYSQKRALVEAVKANTLLSKSSALLSDNDTAIRQGEVSLSNAVSELVEENKGVVRGGGRGNAYILTVGIGGGMPVQQVMAHDTEAARRYDSIAHKIGQGLYARFGVFVSVVYSNGYTLKSGITLPKIEE
jgi:hypothetical protein